MSLTWVVRCGFVLALCACGEHYEGGGRRRELPAGSQTETPPPGIKPGDGSSSQGGTSAGPGSGEAGNETFSGGAG